MVHTVKQTPPAAVVLRAARGPLDWVEAVFFPAWRQAQKEKGANQWRVCPLPSLIKEPLFTSGSGYDKESSQVHIFSPRRVVSFLPPPSKPSPRWHSPQEHCARGQSLDRTRPVRGKPSRPLSVSRLSSWGRKAASLAIHHLLGIQGWCRLKLILNREKGRGWIFIQWDESHSRSSTSVMKWDLEGLLCFSTVYMISENVICSNNITT